jgi:hypothetical protein
MWRYFLTHYAVHVIAGLGLCMAGMPTERMQRMAAALKRVYAKSGMPRKQIAMRLGQSESLLSRQLELRDGSQPGFARQGELPDESLLDLADELCAMVGKARVVRDEKLDRLLWAVETLSQSQERKAS